jgi:hypothetical protein
MATAENRPRTSSLCKDRFLCFILPATHPLVSIGPAGWWLLLDRVTIEPGRLPLAASGLTSLRQGCFQHLFGLCRKLSINSRRSEYQAVFDATVVPRCVFTAWRLFLGMQSVLQRG